MIHGTNVVQHYAFFFHINELILDAALFKKRSAFLVSLHFLVYQSGKVDTEDLCFTYWYAFGIILPYRMDMNT